MFCVAVCCTVWSPSASCKGGITESVQVLLSRGKAAVEAIAAAPDATSRRDADAFAQLQIIRQMMEKAKQQHWEEVLQVGERRKWLNLRDLAVRSRRRGAASGPQAFGPPPTFQLNRQPAAITVASICIALSAAHAHGVLGVLLVLPVPGAHSLLSAQQVNSSIDHAL